MGCWWDAGLPSLGDCRVHMDVAHEMWSVSKLCRAVLLAGLIPEVFSWIGSVL